MINKYHHHIKCQSEWQRRKMKTMAQTVRYMSKDIHTLLHAQSQLKTERADPGLPQKAEPSGKTTMPEAYFQGTDQTAVF